MSTQSLEKDSMQKATDTLLQELTEIKASLEDYVS